MTIYVISLTFSALDTMKFGKEKFTNQLQLAILFQTLCYTNISSIDISKLNIQLLIYKNVWIY